MAVTPLPPRPNLAYYRKQAKALLKSLRAGDSDAVARVREERPQALDPAAATLSDAQWVVAREHGFASWPKFKHHLEALAPARDGFCRPFVRDLQYYSDRAYGLQSVQQSGLPRALQQIREFHPRFAPATDADIRAADFTLDDARLVLAREHGCADWEALAKRIERLACGRASEPFMLAFEAIKAGDAATVTALVETHPDLIDARGTNGNTLLALAGSCRQAKIVRSLIEAGADVDLANDRGGTPLHQAGYGNDPELAEMLIAAGAAIDRCAHGDGGTPLVMALFWGHAAMAERLAQLGVVPSNLRVAAGLGDLERARGFFRPGGSLTPEAGKHRGFYRPHTDFPVWHPSDDPQEILDEALVYAAKSDRAETLAFLAERGAKLDAEPYNGTALHWAVASGALDAASWLLDHGADAHRRARFGGFEDLTPLHCAAWSGRIPAIRLLLERGAELHARDRIHHGTPLGWATFHGRDAARDWILDHGKLHIQDAARHGQLERVRALLDADPALANDFDGWYTPLDQAAAGGRLEVARLLLARGADPARPNGDGKSPLARAHEGSHEALAALLQQR